MATSNHHYAPDGTTAIERDGTCAVASDSTLKPMNCPASIRSRGCASVSNGFDG